MNSNINNPTSSFDPTKYTRSKWLKGADLPKGRSVMARIGRVYEHQFDQTGEVKPVVDLEGLPGNLPSSLALNKTQTEALIDLFGTDVRAWPGQTVSLLAVASAYAGKPSIMIAAGEATPTFGSKPAGYSREDAQRQRQRPPAQPAAVADAPNWATQGLEEDDESIPF